MPSKKAPRAKTAKSLFGARLGGKRVGLTSALGPKTTTAIVIVVLAGGIWVGSRQRLSAKTNQPAASAAVEVQPETTLAAVEPGRNPVAAKPHDVPAPTVNNSLKSKGTVTTLEGCLERNGDEFRLKDPSGADAPKARSWKSGFLKKGAASVNVVDKGESFGLANRVGTRVSVTGTLVDRDMHPRAMHRVASTCN